MPAVLKRVSDRKCSEVEIAAVVIKKTPREGQQHVGIAFRESEQHCALLHLPWHRLPVRDELDQTFYWVQHSIDPLRLFSVLAFCDLIHQSNPGGIPRIRRSKRLLRHPHWPGVAWAIRTERQRAPLSSWRFTRQ